jgi:hypothetical protein
VKPFFEGKTDVIAAFDRFILSLPNITVVVTGLPDLEGCREAPCSIHPAYSGRAPRGHGPAAGRAGFSEDYL